MRFFYNLKKTNLLLVIDEQVEDERRSERVDGWDDDVGKLHVTLDFKLSLTRHPVLP